MPCCGTTSEVRYVYPSTKNTAKLIHSDINENSRLWVYLKDGICYQFIFGILGIPERGYMLLDFPQSVGYTWKMVYVSGSKQNKNEKYTHKNNNEKGFWVYLKDGICYWFPGILGIPENGICYWFPRALGTPERRCMLPDPWSTLERVDGTSSVGHFCFCESEASHPVPSPRS